MRSLSASSEVCRLCQEVCEEGVGGGPMWGSKIAKEEMKWRGVGWFGEVGP